MPEKISHFKKYKEDYPVKYEQIGLMLEDFIANQVGVVTLATKYKISCYTINYFIKEYFGKPNEPFVVEIKLDLPKEKPIPVQLSELYAEYLLNCEKVDKLREEIEKFENNL
jgi:hypothetical protein